MAIPKIIYQTYYKKNFPIFTRFFIWWMQFVNKDYRYEFFDDHRILSFLKENYPPLVAETFGKIKIGAAKGDFFRYAVLYKTGGVYLDLDGGIIRSLDLIIKPADVAVITKESNPDYYVQWALIYDKEHPFLRRTLEKCIENINTNKFPNSVHEMTGPTVYTQAIKECLAEDPEIPYREVPTDYNRKAKGVIIPKHFLNKLLYLRRPHWMKTQKKEGVVG